MSQVGCVYAHPPIDTPPKLISVGPPEQWYAQYYSRAIVYDCRGDRLGDQTLGTEQIRGIKNHVDWEYSFAQRKVREAVPAFSTFIDVRTLKMLQAGCCPHELLEQDLK